MDSTAQAREEVYRPPCQMIFIRDAAAFSPTSSGQVADVVVIESTLVGTVNACLNGRGKTPISRLIPTVGTLHYICCQNDER